MKFLEKIRKIRKLAVGMNERNLGLIYPNNSRADYKYADDKYLAKEILHRNDIACPKTYAVIDTIGRIEQAWISASEWNELVIKPAKGAGGKGIMILKKKGGVWMSQGKQVTEEEDQGVDVRLADQGLDPVDIARSVDRPTGQVELILALRRA